MIQLDKRDWLRIYDKVTLAITVLVNGERRTGAKIAREETLDISEEGLRFHNDRELPVGAVLEMHIEPPDVVAPITRYGRVCWATQAADRPGFEIGVKFLNAMTDDRAAWIAYVRNRVNAAAS